MRNYLVLQRNIIPAYEHAPEKEATRDLRGVVQTLESNWKTMRGKRGNNPHKEKEGKREALKQKLAEVDDELLSTSAKRGCGDKAKRIKYCCRLMYKVVPEHLRRFRVHG